MNNPQNVVQHDEAQDRHKICVALSEINNFDAAKREEICAQAIEMLTAAPALQQRLERAERALLRAGFQDLGAQEWKPPLGKPPIFIEVGASFVRQAPGPLPPIYYVRDNHTTCRLPEHVEGALQEIKRELDDGFTCGGLFTKRAGAKASLSFSYSVPQEEMLQRARSWLTEEIQARRDALAGLPAMP